METTLLSDMLKKKDGEIQFNGLSDTFVCRNEDVENFLKNKAVQSSKLYTSATYLVSEVTDRIDLLGYFTLATKMLTLNHDNLSSKQLKVIKRFVSLDADTNTYRLPAVLLAQFGRNFSERSQSLPGNALMKIVLERTEKAVSLASGKVVFLECEPKRKLLDFYQSCGFFLTDNAVLSKSSRRLVQMFCFI